MISLILDSIISNNVKIFFEDFYLNTTSKQQIRRIYLSVLAHHQQLDVRYFPVLILSPTQFNQFNALQNPLSYISNRMLDHLTKQRDLQQITFSGKLSSVSAERILHDYWQNPIKQGLVNSMISIVQSQEYLTDSSNEFFTTVVYTVTSSDGHAVPQTCFNPRLIDPINSLCTTEKYVTHTPRSFIPSFVDLIGNYTDHKVKIKEIVALALQRIDIHGQSKSYSICSIMFNDLIVIFKFHLWLRKFDLD